MKRWKESNAIVVLTLAAMVVLWPTTALAVSDMTLGGATTKPAADAETELADDYLTDLLKDLTPEELGELIKRAAANRLALERQQVEAEIEQGILYEPDQIKAASKILRDGPANTQKDNIDRICRAFAKVDGRFAEPYKFFAAKKYKQAAEAAEQTVDPTRASYLSAAQHFVYAESLTRLARHEEAVEVYREILINMPDRISFAATSALAAAEGYEKANRFMYAMQMYAYCLRNYSLTISDEKLKQIVKKIETYAEIYKDPLGAVAKKMAHVEKRLAVTDSGKATQKTEEEIIAILDDLIKTAEDQQQQQQQQQQQVCSKCGGKGCSKCKGGQKQGQVVVSGTAGQPKGTGTPSSPAQTSMLVPGAVKRPGKLSNIHKTAESGDWAKLPPRERERLEQIMRKVTSERYRHIIKEYHDRLAELGSE